eukprot:3900073-Pyramimonas_sp.AAC.4
MDSDIKASTSARLNTPESQQRWMVAMFSSLRAAEPNVSGVRADSCSSKAWRAAKSLSTRACRSTACLFLRVGSAPHPPKKTIPPGPRLPRTSP